MTEKGREAKFGEQDVKADHLEVCGHAASFIETDNMFRSSELDSRSVMLAM